MHYQSAGKQEHIEEGVREEIIRALDKTDEEAKFDMNFTRLRDIMLIKEHVGGKNQRNIKEQIKDMVMNRYKKLKPQVYGTYQCSSFINMNRDK